MEAVNDFGQQIVLSSKISSVNGKTAILSFPGAVSSFQNIQSVTTYGKDGLSQTELEFSLSVLHALQGKRSLLNNPWIQLLMISNNSPDLTFDSFDPWQLPSDSATQSCSTQDLLVSPPFVFKNMLNDSQVDAVKHMLKHDNATDYSIIHGPPGTGKTTVIAAFVNSILQGSDRTVWLLAKTNFAVKNIAEKLCKSDILAWRLIISREFFSGWCVFLLPINSFIL